MNQRRRIALWATMWNIIWVVRNIPGIPHTELCLEAETAAYSQKPTSGAVISILAPRPCVAILHQSGPTIAEENWKHRQCIERFCEAKATLFSFLALSTALVVLFTLVDSGIDR